MPRFVLEIGTEEIPPRFFPPALSQLRLDGETMLQRARLVHGEVKVYGAPRRLALVVEEVAAAQAHSVREERGPAAKVAFDAEGKPTKAALGFAKRHGVALELLERRQTDQGEYVFATIQEPEAPAKDALAALLPDLIAGLSFPKSMRWGTGSLRFGRPIRWLLALLDAEVVDFTLGELHSGRLTRGHPVLADGMFEVASAGEYEGALEKRRVMVDPDRRRIELDRQLNQIAAASAASIFGRIRWFSDPISDLVQRPDHFAMDMAMSLAVQTVFLVEWPTAAIGKFDESFLSLPDDVLTAEMQHVQSYFPMASETVDPARPWKLMASFVAVRDGGRDHLDAVIAGWENVLKAKLIDASYFFERDLKKPLADRVEDLRGVVFQKQLGTMYEKMVRIRAIVSDLAAQLSLPDETAQALLRAAELCKADLTTMMVKELSDLQGVMGHVYATRSGEADDVATAIEEHYWPRSARDNPPKGLVGALLGLADKLDGIVACFAMGIVPTGSADPLGLRRDGLGAVRILADTPDDPSTLPVPLSQVSTRRLIDVAIDALRGTLTLSRPASEISKDVMAFLRERLEARLRDQDVRYDLARAALAIDSDIRDSAARARALSSVARRRGFLTTVKASSRVGNITKGFAGGEVDEGLLEGGAERELWDAYLATHAQVQERDDALGTGRRDDDEPRRYQSMLDILGGLTKPIDDFFDAVLVMSEDEKVRNNRLALCWQINQLFRRLADFTLVVQA